VIVPLRKSQALSHAFIYTTVTRAQVPVILMGYVTAAREAVTNAPKWVSGFI